MTQEQQQRTSALPDEQQAILPAPAIHHPIVAAVPPAGDSPYYLGSNDNSGNIIRTIVFHGHNYDEWSESIRLSLIARCKFGFVDGSILRPTDGMLLVDWQCVQAMIVQWLLNTIDVSLKKTIPYFEESKPLWDVLQRRFDVGSGSRKQQLKAVLVECKQPASMSVADYFGKLQPLWDELATYDPPCACNCGLCTCNLGKLFQQLMANDRLHDFYMGLM
ncbi:hypothetical protein LIER_39595 [Lithospermum erythrorhizon]|uniref:Retrotransposon Copia-like N-terminal domain-containing protein n=1 Tax=Lithospermum erythrorhizon TaxID=34254 RepID=A0AAV3QKA8_LITER